MKKQNTLILSIAIIAAIGIGLSVNTNHEETVYIGASLPNFTPEFLADNTAYAIKGKVSDIIPVAPLTDSVGVRNVFTDVVIDVEKDLNGLYADDQITVRYQGGMIDDHTRVISDTAPEFKIGEKVFVFVAEKEPHSIYGDNYYVGGLQHGKYNLDDFGKAKNKDSARDMSEKDLDNIVKKAQDKKQKNL